LLLYQLQLVAAPNSLQFKKQDEIEHNMRPKLENPYLVFVFAFKHLYLVFVFAFASRGLICGTTARRRARRSNT